MKTHSVNLMATGFFVVEGRSTRYRVTECGLPVTEDTHVVAAISVEDEILPTCVGCRQEITRYLDRTREGVDLAARAVELFSEDELEAFKEEFDHTRKRDEAYDLYEETGDERLRTVM